MSISDFPIIELDKVDSTNNYAMQLIDADKAQGGLTVVAHSQEAGKGQRGKDWVDEPGQSLLMSIIVEPKYAISEQFVLSASVAVAIANVLQKLPGGDNIYIKWPNDIIINDKKAGGILIENILRGSKWTHSVIGLGLNIGQDSFPDSLPNATSLKMALGTEPDRITLRDDIRLSIINAVLNPEPAEEVIRKYNEHLYKRARTQAFGNEGKLWDATVLSVDKNGTLTVVKPDGEMPTYKHGDVTWKWI